MDMILRKLVGKDCVFYTSIAEMPSVEGRVTDVSNDWIEILWNGGYFLKEAACDSCQMYFKSRY